MQSPSPKDGSILRRLSAVASLRATFWGVLCLLLVGAFYYGWSQWQDHGANAHFYQGEYSIAVTYACTGEMRAIVGERPVALEEFLSVKRQHLECSDVFPLPKGARLGALNVLQEQIVGSAYLFGGIWKVAGISWDSGAVLAGLYCVAALLGFVLIATLLLPHWLALVAASLIFFLDDPSRDQIIHLRDYSKAAFFFLLLYLLVVIHEAVGWRKIALAGLTGVVLATALGFRQDTSPFLYLAGLVLLLGLVERQGRGPALGAIVAFAAVLAAYPLVFFDFWKAVGTNVYHFFLLGQTAPFLADLHLNPSEYVFGYRYNDIMTWAIVGLFEAAKGIDPLPPLGTDAYNAAGRSALLLTTYQFPADAAAKSVSGFALALFGWLRTSLSVQLLTALLIFSILLFQWRKRALILLLATVFFAAITFVQYDIRHVFPYQMLGKLLLVCALAGMALTLVRRWIPSGTEFSGTGPSRQRIAYALVPFVLLGIVILFCLAGRQWQAATWQNIATALDAASARSIATRASLIVQPDKAGALIPLQGEAGQDLRYARLRFERTRECARAPFLTFRYDTDERYYNWTERLTFFPRQTATIYLPLIQVNWNRLTGIELDARSAGCFISLEEIDLPPDVYPAIYWMRDDPSLDRHYYKTGFEEELGTIVSRGIEKFRSMTCLPAGPAMSGSTPPVDISHSMVIGDVIEIRVDETSDGYASDHVDLIDPRIVVNGAATSLLELDIVRSNIPYYTLEYGQTIEKKPLNLNGQTYQEGFGIHAPAMIRFAVPEDLRGKQATIEMLAGIDDETEGRGSAAVTLCYSQ
jgi:hypothetical protein